MITISSLLFFFLATMALVCILVLQALTLNQRLKIGYVALAITLILWAWGLYTLPTGPGTWWLYALPLVWLILIFAYAFPHIRSRHYPNFTGEPHYTEEYLRGAPGTREALTFYFLLLLIGLIVVLVFLDLTQLYR